MSGITESKFGLGSRVSFTIGDGVKTNAVIISGTDINGKAIYETVYMRLPLQLMSASFPRFAQPDFCECL